MPVPHVCMYTPSARGGHPLYTRELLSALTEQAGPHFELVSSEDLDEQFRAASYQVHPILPPLRNRSHFSNAFSWAASRLAHYPQRELAFLKWLKGRPDIDVVHFQEFSPLLARHLVERTRKLGKRVFYTVHNLRPHAYPPLISHTRWDRWHHDAWRRCDGLFVLTDRLAQQLSDLLGKPHPPIYVAPHGTWTVDRSPQSPARLEQRLALKRLLFFGTIRRNKGVEHLLRAAEQLPGYAITIAGEPLDKAYFEQELVPLAEKLRRSGRSVELRRGFASDAQAAELFATHSALVLPYTQNFESQSGVLFLALAHEIPVIATPVGGLRDVLNEYRIGVAVEDASPGGLAGSIQSYFAQATELEWKRDLKLARERFSWSAAAAATLDGYGATAEKAEDRHALSCT